MKYLDTVNELNGELYEKHGVVEEQFYYTTNGIIDIIGFGNIMLWNSEEDDRKFIEETDNYEPFTPYIKEKFNEYLNKLQKFYFK